MSSKKHHSSPQAHAGHAPAPSQAEHDFGPPIDYVLDGKAGTLHTLDDAIALVEPRAGTFEHPDGIWRGVLEALHFARSSGQAEEVVNARGMLETAIGAPGAEFAEDEDESAPG